MQVELVEDALALVFPEELSRAILVWPRSLEMSPFLSHSNDRPKPSSTMSNTPTLPLISCLSPQPMQNGVKVKAEILG